MCGVSDVSGVCIVWCGGDYIASGPYLIGGGGGGGGGRHK